jgi:hypothetical protein
LFHAALESCPIASVKKKVQLLMDGLIERFRVLNGLEGNERPREAT